MRFITHTLANTNAISLATIAGGYDRCSKVILQAGATNTDVVYIGDAGAQPMFLNQEAFIAFNPSRLSDVYIRGTASDVVIIGYE